MDLEGQLSNPRKDLKTLTPQGSSAKPGTRQDPRTRPKQPRARHKTRPSHALEHYSNPAPETAEAPRPKQARGTPPPAAPHRTQSRLRAHDVDALTDAYRAGATIKELAEQYGIARTTVMAHLDRRHVQRRLVAKQWDDDALAAAANSYALGSSLADIASEHNLDPKTVANRFRRAGVTIRPRPGWK